jgi:hypothetical protein
MDEAARFSLQRHFRGGTAYFGPGYALLGVRITSKARLTADVLVETDADTILIGNDPRVFTEERIKAMLVEVGSPLRTFDQATLAQRSKWNATTVAGFYKPESAHAALKRLDGVPHVQSRLLYTVCFIVPGEIASLVYAEVELIVSRVVVDLVREPYTRGKVRLCLSGTDKEVVANTKHNLGIIFAGRLATISTRTGISAQCPELWHELFGSTQGKAWLRKLSRSTPNCCIVGDEAHQRIRIYTSANTDHVAQQFERILADKIERRCRSCGQREHGSREIQG